MSERNHRDDELVRIPLGHNVFALVDTDDVERVLRNGPWHCHKVRGQVYAAHALWPIIDGKRSVLLHRFILNALPKTLVMHRNGNGLDCRKVNLCFGDRHKNGASFRRKQGVTSVFRGVSRNIGRKPWQAGIMVKGKKINLGRYDTEIEAASAYNNAATKHFGEFAAPNILP